MDRARTNFTIRDLENLTALAECESVTLAAVLIGLSQPAMSSALKNLEETLNTTLFIRHRGKGVTLTPEGTRFAVAARSILAQAGQLQADMSGLSNEESGRLHVAALSTVAPIVTASLLRAFVDQHAGIAVELVTGSQDQLLSSLTRGEVHVAITYDMGLQDQLRFEHLADAVPHVMLSANHPLAQRTSLALTDLVAEPYILLDLPISRDYFMSLFLAVDLVVRPAARYTDLAVVRSMVGNEFGYSLVNLLPARAEALDATQLVYIPLESEVGRLSLGIAVRRDERRLRAVEAFIEHAHTHGIAITTNP